MMLPSVLNSSLGNAVNYLAEHTACREKLKANLKSFEIFEKLHEIPYWMLLLMVDHSGSSVAQIILNFNKYSIFFRDNIESLKEPFFHS